MKTVSVIVLALVALAAADVHQTRYMLFPDGYGKLHLIDLEAEDIEPIFNVETGIHFNLFTKSNPTTYQRIINRNETSLSASNFNPKHQTRILCHGWNSGSGSSISVDVRNAYLSQGDFNVFVMDWTKGSNTLNYISAKNRVGKTGQFVATFVDFLVKFGKMKIKDLHMAGHSLGAHVVGVAGRNIESGKPHSVFGLDPALPLFSINNPDNRINPDSADYVEIIHSNGNLLGFLEPIGTTDFYPNGGKSQPGCFPDLSGACAHDRAVLFFAESIWSDLGFWSWNCESYKELMKGKCTVINKIQPMGSPKGLSSLNGVASGIFYVKTNKKKPYAHGFPTAIYDTLINV